MLGYKSESHELGWVAEPFWDEPDYIEKPMFGSVACYLHGRLVLVLAARGEPWQGLLVPTERQHQASIVAQHPALAPHPVLGKWLYLPEAHDEFEEVATELVRKILVEDPRLGVEPGGKLSRKKRQRRSK